MKKKILGIGLMVVALVIFCFMDIEKSNTFNVLTCLGGCAVAAFGLKTIIQSFIK